MGTHLLIKYLSFYCEINKLLLIKINMREDAYFAYVLWSKYNKGF